MAVEPIITIDHVELSGSPSDGFRADNKFWGRRILRCLWDERIEFMRQLKGGYRDDETGTWRLPAQYPWNEFARVDYCGSTPWPKPPKGADAAFDDGATHENAVITVNYSVGQISTQTGEAATRLREYQFNSNPEYLRRQVKDTNHQPALWWTNDNTPVNVEDAPDIPVFGTQMALEIFQVKTLSDHIDDWAGAINNTAINSAYLPSGHPGFAKWTLRYDGPQYGITFTSEGEARWNVLLMFSHRALLWNKFYRPGQTTPEYMYKQAADHGSDNAYLPYPKQELNTLISDML